MIRVAPIDTTETMVKNNNQKKIKMSYKRPNHEAKLQMQVIEEPVAVIPYDMSQKNLISLATSLNTQPLEYTGEILDLAYTDLQTQRRMLNDINQELEFNKTKVLQEKSDREYLENFNKELNQPKAE